VPSMKPWHVYPVSADQTDLAHEPGAPLTRDRPEPDCPLCAAGWCWQEVMFKSGVEVVLHGVVLA